MWQASADMPKPDDLGVNARAARLRDFERLQHQHGRAFAQNHAAAVFGKRPAGVRRHHPHGLPRLQDAETERRFAAAGERQVGGAAAHHPVRLSDGVAAEEHAVEMVKLGPVIPNSMEMWLAPALAIVLGMVSGWTRFCPLL